MLRNNYWLKVHREGSFMCRLGELLEAAEALADCLRDEMDELQRSGGKRGQDYSEEVEAYEWALERFRAVSTPSEQGSHPWDRDRERMKRFFEWFEEPRSSEGGGE